MDNLRNAQDFRYNLQITRWLLQPLGIWPAKLLVYYQIILSYVSIVICTFLLIFLLVPFCLQAYIEKDFMMRLLMIGPISFIFINSLKYCMLLVKKNDIENCILQIAVDWHEIIKVENKNTMLKNAKAARFSIILCMYLMYGGGIFYSIMIPLIKNIIAVDSDSNRNLAYPCYFAFFDPYIRPAFDIIFWTHSLGSILIFTVTIGTFSIIIVCIMHATSQCSITSEMIRKLNNSTIKKSLKYVVIQHLQTLKFASKLEEIFNCICLMELVGCTFNLILLGYYLILQFQQNDIFGIITIGMLLMSQGFNILIYCFAGDLFTRQYKSIGEVAFSIKWYELNSAEIRNITLIIILTQRPTVLTAGKMMILSIKTFCNVMKAFVTYLNLLRTLVKNEFN